MSDVRAIQVITFGLVDENDEFGEYILEAFRECVKNDEVVRLVKDKDGKELAVLLMVDKFYNRKEYTMVMTEDTNGLGRVTSRQILMEPLDDAKRRPVGLLSTEDRLAITGKLFPKEVEEESEK